jgi:hypothetical protein
MFTHFSLNPRYTPGSPATTDNETFARALAHDEAREWGAGLDDAPTADQIKAALGGIVVEWYDKQQHGCVVRHWKDIITGTIGCDVMGLGDIWDGPGNVRTPGAPAPRVVERVRDIAAGVGPLDEMRSKAQRAKLANGFLQLMDGAEAQKRAADEVHRASIDAKLGCSRTTPERRRQCLSTPASGGRPCYYCPNRSVTKG